MSALCRAVAPLEIRVRFEPQSGRFELTWDGPHGTEQEAAEDLQLAVRAAHTRLVGRRAPVTEPAGDTSFAEAMRELIECTEPARRPAVDSSGSPRRPALRLVR